MARRRKLSKPKAVSKKVEVRGPGEAIDIHTGRETAVNRTRLLSLPPEIVYIILQKVPREALFRVRLTCSALNRFAHNILGETIVIPSGETRIKYDIPETCWENVSELRIVPHDRPSPEHMKKLWDNPMWERPDRRAPENKPLDQTVSMNRFRLRRIQYAAVKSTDCLRSLGSDADVHFTSILCDDVFTSLYLPRLIHAAPKITGLTFHLTKSLSVEKDLPLALEILVHLEALHIILVNTQEGSDRDDIFNPMNPLEPQHVAPLWGLISRNHNLKELTWDFCNPKGSWHSDLIGSSMFQNFRSVGRWTRCHGEHIFKLMPPSSTLQDMQMQIPSFEKKSRLKLKQLDLGCALHLNEIAKKSPDWLLTMANPTHLCSLSLVDCGNSDLCLEVVAKQLASLKALKVCRSISMDTLAEVLEMGLPALRVLQVVSWESDKPLNLRCLLRHKDSLRFLWIENEIRGVLQLDLASWPVLEELAISMDVVNLEKLPIPPSLRYLRQLSRTPGPEGDRIVIPERPQLCKRAIRSLALGQQHRLSISTDSGGAAGGAGGGLLAVAISRKFCGVYYVDHGTIYVVNRTTAQLGEVIAAHEIHVRKWRSGDRGMMKNNVELSFILRSAEGGEGWTVVVGHFGETA